VLHPKDEYFLATLRQRELIAIARADRIRAPRPPVAPHRLPQLRTIWHWLRARVSIRRHPARPA
jgi:hypothetical protein